MFLGSSRLLGVVCGAFIGSTFIRRSVAFTPKLNTRQVPIMRQLYATSAKSLPSNAVSKTEDDVYIVTSMPDPLPEKLNNSYYLLRHGQSWGNVAAVISSARSLATSEKHGLTPLGYEQGKASAKDFIDLLSSSNDIKDKKRIVFYSSPFARARQTANACIDGLQESDDFMKKLEEMELELQPDIVLEDGLMERFFGRLDDAEIHTYAFVWPVDMYDTTHTAFEVESVAAVSTRIREALLDIDSKHKDDIIVLVSHADVLQITQLYAAGAENVGTFSSYRFTNGEIREMARSVDSLPEPQPLEPPKPGT